MNEFVDQLLVGKTIKSAERLNSGLTIVFFTDGSLLNIFIDDNDELVCELVGRENEYHD